VGALGPCYSPKGGWYDQEMKRNRYLALSVAFFVATVSRAQTSATSHPQTNGRDDSATQTRTTLRTSTRLVQLNVIVQDKKGKLVEDLKTEDFTLLDNGKPQRISLFSTELLEQAGNATQAVETKSVAPPNVFGNRIHHADEKPGSATIILFDALNTSFTDQAYARGQVLKFLHQLQPQDHVAIYLLTTKLMVINEFTQDSKSLLQAIERFQSYPSILLNNATQPYMVPADTGIADPKAAARLAGLMNNMISKMSDLSNYTRVGITAQAIEAIGNHVAGIPGRKNLVWVSGSFPISISFQSNDQSPVDAESQNFQPAMERVARVLNQSNMAIYPVDARGLLVNGEFDASRQHPFAAGAPATETGVGQDEDVTMNVLAEQTGGHAFHNTNDIQGAIRRTLNDSRFTYLLGFYPGNADWDGKFHELKLSAKKSGLVLRYRKGYYALPDPTDGAEEAHKALEAALWSPVDATSLEIQAAIRTIEPAERKLDLRVKVDVGGLRLEETDGWHRGSVDTIYIQLGPGDAVVAADPLTYKLNVNEQEYQAILKRGYELKAPLVIHPTTRMLRVLVRDGASGTLGSVTIPLEKFLPPQTAKN
jgi:VWFA-related protein